MRFLTTLLLCLTAASAAHATPDQVAASYDAAIVPAHNTYGSPSTIWWSAGDLYANTKCSGYAALLEEAAYAAITPAVVRGLVGDSLPTSAEWKAALDAGATYTDASGTYQMVTRPTIDAILEGDLFASDYTIDGATGHALVVASTSLSAVGVPTTLPGEATADRWLVFVHDSTETPHGTTDSRYHAGAGGADVQGIGHGWLYFYADATSGAIVGWTWSTASTTIYQATDPDGANYRPLTIGAITGPGI